jgi:3-dehydroquinate synthase
MTTTTINVNLSNDQYNIFINDGCFCLSQIHSLLTNRKIAIISNETVAPLYLNSLKKELSKYNDSLISLNLPDGEKYKNQKSLNMIFDFLATNNFNRSDLLISLGGGVICDMTGFAAASWMRGIDFIQIPTSLLAQVDASVGGKTGINHEKGKNLIGAFHQPKAVIINTATLNTLSTKEFKSGLGEVVKYGFINQPEFLSWLSDHSTLINALDLPTMSKLIAKCCSFKTEIVQQDEKESGVRALLNLGHTFAHAIETYTQYKVYSHGEAVSIGMVMAAELSAIIDLSNKNLRKELEKHLQQFHLEIKLTKEIMPQELVRLMRLDKKVIANKHRLILLKSLGEALIKTDVCEENILQAIINCQ